MKKSILAITAVSFLLSGCGTAVDQEPELHIATIPAQPDAPVSSVSVPPTEETQPEVSAEHKPPESTTEMISATDTTDTASYEAAMFDRAVFAAVMDPLTDVPGMYLLNDIDGDGMTEFLLAVPVSDTQSWNIILESPGSAGVYYYQATGLINDYFVIDPEDGQGRINENNHSDTGEIISSEYFRWTGTALELTSQLYGGSCYWNYQGTSSSDFLAKAAAMQSVQNEEIFNLVFSGTPEQIANSFHEYLSGYFKQVKPPVAADIDGNGSIEQVIVIQNLTKRWASNIISLYDQDETMNTDPLANVHTTCFVLDDIGNGMTRLRPANFDRKYTFAAAGGRLFAYDDTNTMQTIEYSTENAAPGKQFMSIMWG